MKTLIITIILLIAPLTYSAPNLGVQCISRHGTTTDEDNNRLNEQGKWFASNLPNIIHSNCSTEAIFYNSQWDWIYETVEPSIRDFGLGMGFSESQFNGQFEGVVTTPNANNAVWAASMIHNISPILCWYSNQELEALSTDQAYNFYFMLDIKSNNEATIKAIPTGQLHEFTAYDSVLVTPDDVPETWSIAFPSNEIWFFNKKKMIIRDLQLKTKVPSGFDNAAPMNIRDFQYFKDISMPEDVLSGWQSIFLSYDISQPNEAMLWFYQVAVDSKSWSYNLTTGEWASHSFDDIPINFYWVKNNKRWLYTINNDRNSVIASSGEDLIMGHLSEWNELADMFKEDFRGAFYVPGCNLLGCNLLVVYSGHNFQTIDGSGRPHHIDNRGIPFTTFGHFPGLQQDEVIWRGRPKSGGDSIPGFRDACR